MHYRYAKQNIPIELLRTFVALVELKNFTKVGQSLELTQPAVSAQLKRLQGLLGNDLLDRKAPGVVLSPIGEAIVRYARRVLDINDQIIQIARTGHKGHVIRLGMPTAFLRAILPHHEALYELAKSELLLSSDTTENLLNMLQRGYLDLVIGITETPGEALHSWPESLVWAQRPNSLLSDQRPLPFVNMPTGLSDRLGRSILERSKIPYRVAFIGSDIPNLLDALAEGVGIAPIPRRLLGAGLACIEHGLPELPPVFGGIHMRADADRELLSPTSREILRMLGIDPGAQNAGTALDEVPRQS